MIVHAVIEDGVGRNSVGKGWHGDRKGHGALGIKAWVGLQGCICAATTKICGHGVAEDVVALILEIGNGVDYGLVVNQRGLRTQHGFAIAKESTEQAAAERWIPGDGEARGKVELIGIIQIGSAGVCLSAE